MLLPKATFLAMLHDCQKFAERASSVGENVVDFLRRREERKKSEKLMKMYALYVERILGEAGHGLHGT